MNLQATEDIKVFIDKGTYGNTPLNATDVDKIPENRRKNLSWKGCYYTILKNEKFIFDRTNNYDKCYFKLQNGAEFMIECGKPETFINHYNVKII